MVKYVIRRFLELLLALFLIATATFFLTAAAPGDPLIARTMSLPEASREALYAKYGLDKPLMERYVITMKGMLHGDFGESVVYEGQTLQDILRDKLPVSARLGLQALLLGVIVGLLLGILAAIKRETWIDRVVVVFAVLLMSVPELVLGLMFQKFFAGTLKWFPVIGWPSGDQLWLGGWKYTVLPTLSCALLHIATYSRLMKTSILDVMDQDYILTARSKGLSEPRIVWSHILRNSFIPIVTRLPVSVATCITGSFIIEKIFSIPGIAAYYIEAVSANDLSIVLGETVFIAALFIAVVFLTDILYTVVDPRIRIQGGKR
ncbi:MAG: ABC transporter permease [Oscillospiraceae bacterium]|nr:ABC transporter permease [Oscillospiraceae bacterium]MCD8322968.1 ABC transporter permease [Oscillospiraceae bacterium]